jgi:hypothetical protein
MAESRFSKVELGELFAAHHFLFKKLKQYAISFLAPGMVL